MTVAFSVLETGGTRRRSNQEVSIHQMLKSLKPLCVLALNARFLRASSVALNEKGNILSTGHLESDVASLLKIGQLRK